MDFDKFDKHFGKVEKAAGKIIGISVIGAIVSALVGLGILVAVIAVAWHFIAKLW